MIRSCAAIAEKDTVHRTIPAKAVRPRNTCLLLIIVILLFEDSWPREAFHETVRERFATSLPLRMLSRSATPDPAARRIAGLRRGAYCNQTPTPENYTLSLHDAPA